MEKLAVIDLGSNSIRMSIFEIYEDKTFSQVGNFRSMIKLSEGMSKDLKLTPEAQIRAVRALLEYKKILGNGKVDNIRGVATAAVRKAENGREFLGFVKDATGIDIEVIDGEREAALDCLAISKTLNIQKGIICDIGGGSTELIALADGKIQKPAISIPMGSRSLTEEFFQNGENEKAFETAEKYIKSQLEKASWMESMDGAKIIGIGGTLRSIAKYHMADGGSSSVAGYEMTSEEIDEIFREILDATPEERCKMTGIGKERADIIVSGMLILMELKKRVNSPGMIVSDVGVREGILFDYIEKNL